ncbi:MAG: L,D-transpeptidase, partial [Lachnospiraceae bacterium]|nr:L,D-transpeptidase [Lachnospiraceae bacterium]
MEKKGNHRRNLLRLLLSLMLIMSFGFFAKPADAEGEDETNTADKTVDINVSREDGQCTFTVSGLDAEGSKVTVEAAEKSTGEVKFTKDYEGTSETLSESIALSDLDYAYAIYSVTVKVDDVAVGEPVDCDFSIHSNKMDLSIAGDSYAAKRTFSLNSTEKNGVLVPGKGNKVSVCVWRGKAEADAEQVGKTQNFAGTSVQWKNVNIASTTQAAYGKWNAKVVLTNSKSDSITLTTATYEVKSAATSLVTKKTAALEKKQAFRVQLKGAKSPYGVNKAAFTVYSSAGKKIVSVVGVKSGSTYKADIKYELVGYRLEKLKIKAVIFDKKGKTSTLSKTASVNLTAKSGKVKVKKNKDVTCDYILTGAYVPGNIKKLQFVVYLQKNGKLVKQKSYVGTGSVVDKKYSVNAQIEKTGSFTVYAYAYTAWGKRIKLSSKDYKIVKKDLGKQGWYYEKVNGTTYKFYYEDNKKVTDLTKILNLKKNGGSKMYIEVNRAACVVTFYLYDTKTKKYDIPIKSATVCVGADVGTVAGAAALNVKSSFTPIGTYSVCSNGAAVRYTLKPMHEPDGRTIYARWCTHIVGNVYFHAIAVSTQSHYALPSYKFNRLGSPASAGCIRMTVADAKWLYDYVPTGTTVKINVGSSSKPGPYGKPATIKANGINYDPTDPEVPDSRKKADYKA